MNNKSIVRILGIPALILMIPLIAMQFSNEVNWDFSDFLIMGIILVTASSFFELVLQKGGKNKAVWAILILLGTLYIWAELAVGILTNLGS